MNKGIADLETVSKHRLLGGIWKRLHQFPL
jgi:hypothetical protein